MFKSFISYLLGFLAGFYLCTALVLGSNSITVAIGVIIITFALALFLSNKVHIHMKQKHDDMLKSKKWKSEW
jgi:hypothetical protein